MKRALTTREKVLLLVLVMMIIVLGYFKLILEPINLQVEELNAKTMQEQILVDQQRIQLAKMQRMQKKLEEMKETGNYEAIPNFDNSSAVTLELHAVLADTEYQLSAEPTVTTDYIVERPIALQFTAASYEQVRGILERLNDSEYFNMISDLNISWETRKEQIRVNVTMRITYYEVMLQS